MKKIMHQDSISAWATNAAQGLAFWIGHRQALYRHYPLSEGALVAEACNLIHANIDEGLELLCECRYTKLISADNKSHKFGSRDRADLVIVQTKPGRGPVGDLSAAVYSVIEVKRAKAGRKLIEEDLRRLWCLKTSNPKVQALLLVISESRRPARFVSENGLAVRGRQKIQGVKGYFCVRRVCKATASFARKESAHYACLIEVLI
jgi:hypothetical protein